VQIQQLAASIGEFEFVNRSLLAKAAGQWDPIWQEFQPCH
jgi:hypothetical protein